jgi:hypothetical protein
MPEETETPSGDHRYIPKFLGVGTHKVTIVSCTREISNDKPYLQIGFSDMNGSLANHRQYCLSKEGTKFNIFYELFIRSLANLNKVDKAYLARMLLLSETSPKILVGAALSIDIDYKDEGYVIKKDIEGKSWVIEDRQTKKYFAPEMEFAKFMDAKNYVIEYNKTAKVPLKFAMTQVQRYEKDASFIDAQSNILLAAIAESRVDKVFSAEAGIPEKKPLPPRKPVAK